MGWLSDLWEGVKSTAGNIWSGIKKGASAVYDVVRKPVDIIAGAGDFISKIPVIGTALSPVIAGAKGAQSLLDQAKTVGDVVKSVGLENGGMVGMAKHKKYYQA